MYQLKKNNGTYLIKFLALGMYFKYKDALLAV